MDRILIILENKSPGLHPPFLQGLFSIIFKHVYWYIQQISGERLQDHWSSGSYFCSGHRFRLHIEAVLKSTHSLCFGAKIKRKCLPM